MTKICNLLKLFWEPGPQRYLRRSPQKGIPAATSPACGSLALVSVKSIPQRLPQSSPWVTPCISSSQLINSAAGWHHTLLPRPHSLCRAQGESGGAHAVALLLLAYAWSAALADSCRGLLPSRGQGYFSQSWERSGDEALTHADLAIISVPESKTKARGDSPVFHGPAASLPLTLGLPGLPRFPGLARDSEKLRPPRGTQPGRLSSGSNSHHSQAWASTPKCSQVFKNQDLK